MDVQLFVRNLPRSTTREELGLLFMQTGEVIAVRLMNELKSGESRGYAFIAMETQSEVDRAISLFNSDSPAEHPLKVGLTQPGQQCGLA
jgi:RNA recognition motif-containing protein